MATPVPADQDDRKKPRPTANAGPPVSAQGTAQTTNSMPPQPEIGGMIRFPIDNPRFAMQNAMRSRGMNPFLANPGIQMMLNAAPGLGNAFMLRNMGGSPDEITGAGGTGQMFGSYLENLLGGGGGGIFGALGTAQSNMRPYMNVLSAATDRLNSGAETMETLNPILAYMLDVMGSPQGASSLTTSLMAPFVSPRMAQSYGGSMQDIASVAVDRQGQDFGRGGPQRNFWEYLFPDV